MSQSPLFSLIMCVKNGMPYLPQALESVKRQTFGNFELVIQDGVSTDGSLEYLRSVQDFKNMSLVSEPDNGVGDAYHRAVRRCRGRIIGSIDADNLLEPDALEVVAAYFEQHPKCGAVYGVSRMISETSEVLSTFVPAPFDVIQLAQCRLVPPFAASFFSREVLGEHLDFDSEFKTCADFDLWLRISSFPIERISNIVMRTRISSSSMTCRSETYDRFIQDKSRILKRYLDKFKNQKLADSFYRFCLGGIYQWAGESVERLEGRSERFARYLKEAVSLRREFPAYQNFQTNSELSILIPKFSGQIIAPFLTAARNQTGRSYEVVLIYPSGSQGCVESMAALALEYPEVKGIPCTAGPDLNQWVERGFEIAQGQWNILLGSFEPEAGAAIKKMYDLAKQEFDFINTSRFLKDGRYESKNGWARFSRAFCESVFHFLSGSHFSDSSSSLKMFRKSLWDQIYMNRFHDWESLNVELCVRAQAQGFKTAEIPVVLGDTTENKQSSYLFALLWGIFHLRKKTSSPKPPQSKSNQPAQPVYLENISA